jgi:hypothetical protein
MRRRTGLAVRALALVTALLAAACTTSDPVVTDTMYEYSLAATADDVRPGELLPLTWRATPRLVRGEVPAATGWVAAAKGWLCAALVGPYPSVEALKSSTFETRTCPIQVAGTILATDAAEADHVSGTPVTQNLTLPASLAPGYYQLLSLSTYTSAGASSSGGGSTSMSRIIRIIPR